MTDDLIKREDAIEALGEEPYVWTDDDEFAQGERSQWISDVSAIKAVPSADRPQGKWIPCSERLPSEKERKEWIGNNLDGIGYLYPCLVTRYSSINPDRTKNNPYVAKHYFDGEDFVNGGEEVCSEYILAWMPLPQPWKGADDE